MKSEQREKILLLSLLAVICVILALIFFWPSDSSNEESGPVQESTPIEIESSETESSAASDSFGETESMQESESSEESVSAGESESQQDSESSQESESSQSSLPVGGNATEDDIWNLLLVNPDTYLPEDFTVTLANYNAIHKVDARILDALKAMMSACRAAGLDPQICSSYRDLETQTVLYERRIQRFVDQGYSLEEATELAGTIVAVPGTSEHHTGLAVDIVANSNWNLDESQEKTAEQQWLMAHCHEYGFILRYPTGRTDITGIIYEPWHYRYVGVEHATYIMENDITLEEYLALFEAGDIEN